MPNYIALATMGRIRRVPSSAMLAAMLVRNIKDNIASVAMLISCGVPSLWAMATVCESFVTNAPALATMCLARCCPKLIQNARATVRSYRGVKSDIALAAMCEADCKNLVASTAVIADSRIPRNFAFAAVCETFNVYNVALAAVSMRCRIIDNLTFATMHVIARKLNTTDSTMMKGAFTSRKLLLAVAAMHLAVRCNCTATFTCFCAFCTMGMCTIIPTLMAVTTMFLRW